jgi:hypothetical protein
MFSMTGARVRHLVFGRSDARRSVLSVWIEVGRAGLRVAR